MKSLLMKSLLSRKANTFVFGSLFLVAALPASATMLVDRGLPTANLNNAAGANRANVAWVWGDYSSSSSPYTVMGDTFMNSGAEAWTITDIRLWTVGPTTTATLWGGVSGSTIGVVSSSGTITSGVTYNNDGVTTYETQSSTYLGINQVDFAVNITLDPGQTYDFFLDGTGGKYTVPFLHASNAALSGSPQDQADGSMLTATISGGTLGSIGTYDSNGNGWDKSSDANVQVFGTVPDAASTVGLLGLAFLSLVLFSFRQNRLQSAK